MIQLLELANTLGTDPDTLATFINPAYPPHVDRWLGDEDVDMIVDAWFADCDCGLGDAVTACRCRPVVAQ